MTEKTQPRARSRVRWTLIAAAAVSFLAGQRLGPVVYPYGQFISDSTADIFSTQLRSFWTTSSYLNPDAIYEAILFAISLSILIMIRRVPTTVFAIVLGAALGIYYDVMIEGAQANGISRGFESFFGFPPEDDGLTLGAYYITYLLAMIALPVAFFSLLSLAGKTLTRSPWPRSP